MDLISAFRQECTLVQSDARDKESLLRQISSLAKKCSVLENITEEAIFSGLSKREELGSTGFQNGIAIPHSLMSDVAEFVVGMVLHASGVDFRSLDGKPTRLIPFIIGPKDEKNTHIRILSAISRILNDKETVDELLSSTNETVLSEHFLRHVSGTIAQGASAKRNIVIVTIQDESIFEEILQLVSEFDDAYISVLEGHDCSEHLRGLPLFAAFWNDDKRGFHRIILASIKHTLTNELLRRLETLVGGFERRKGLLVQTIETLYASGQLDI
ncbi:MAG: PTS sugar transporter subunit IIA [Chitinispirillaceae bacterium]|nr:PTS sugar transporter subunit IIA [Chitinispirillaceae bacterium]